MPEIKGILSKQLSEVQEMGYSSLKEFQQFINSSDGLRVYYFRKCSAKYFTYLAYYDITQDSFLVAKIKGYETNYITLEKAEIFSRAVFCQKFIISNLCFVNDINSPKIFIFYER